MSPYEWACIKDKLSCVVGVLVQSFESISLKHVLSVFDLLVLHVLFDVFAGNFLY